MLAYRQAQDLRRREALTDMVRQGEELDLEYQPVAIAAVLDANVLYPCILGRVEWGPPG